MLLHLLKQLWRQPQAPGQAVEDLLASVREAFNANNITAAKQAIGVALAADPGNDTALFYSGVIAYKRGNFVEALSAFRSAAARAPANLDYRYHMAACYFVLGDAAQARRCCDAVLAAQPDHPGTHQLMARLNLPGPDYTDVLAAIHRKLRPATYLEIGVATGSSIALAGSGTTAIGIDPEPAIDHLLGPNIRIFALKSDEFFRRYDVKAEFGGRPVVMAFIDGMHRFEFALRDFVAIERYCASSSILLLHDCYPLDRRTAERDRITTFWSGDIWRLVLALKKYRPDLEIHTIATPPTGLALIRHLDPGSRILAERIDDIVREFLAVDFSALDADKPGILNLFPNDWPQVEALLDQNSA